jgi:hypothetical protein
MARTATTTAANDSIHRQLPLQTTLDSDFIYHNLHRIAPEAVLSHTASSSGDVYSFGVMAYQLLTSEDLDVERESVDPLSDVHRHVTTDFPSLLERMSCLSRRSAPQHLIDIVHICLAKNADIRYPTMAALSSDLRMLIRELSFSADLDFQPGEISELSRFSLPMRPLNCADHLGLLDEAHAALVQSRFTATDPRRVFTVYGLSGSGKSCLVDFWTNFGIVALIGRAKLDERLNSPMSSFIQTFESLLAALLLDPTEDPEIWRNQIRSSLGGQYPSLLALLSQDSRRLLEETELSSGPASATVNALL